MRGVDLAGHVIDSRDPCVRPGDGVMLTGWRVGEVTWGGYAEEARVKADRLVSLPKGLSPRATKVIGTAGLTAMLALQALEDRGQTHGAGPVLVTGAAGGVGSRPSRCCRAPAIRSRR